MTHTWTQRWWETLPSAYKQADRAQRTPTDFPLMKFMDGPGQIGGFLREVSDDGWAGRFTDPATVRDEAVYWLAQMLGVSLSQRAKSPEAMRQYLVDITQNGRPATGSRQAIADVAKTFLTGSKMVSVVPSKTAAHTIVILVRAEEVPGGSLSDLITWVRAANVVPAGHDVQAINAQPTWDEFDEAAGATWNDFDAQATSWAAGDSIGVSLE